MNKIQFYKYSSIALLIINLAIISFFFFGRPKHKKHRPKKVRATEIMNLDKGQNEKFFKLADTHMTEMKALEKSQRELLATYFENIMQRSDNTKNQDSLLQKVQIIEKEKVKSTYQHFEDIKSILRPEQLDDFKKFVEQALGRIL